MELYYPMNLIDYILEFCEPYDVDGNYNYAVGMLKAYYDMTKLVSEMCVSNNLVNSEDNVLRCKPSDKSYLISLVLMIIKKLRLLIYLLV